MRSLETAHWGAQLFKLLVEIEVESLVKLTWLNYLQVYVYVCTMYDLNTSITDEKNSVSILMNIILDMN